MYFQMYISQSTAATLKLGAIKSLASQCQMPEQERVLTSASRSAGLLSVTLQHLGDGGVVVGRVPRLHIASCQPCARLQLTRTATRSAVSNSA